MRLPRALWSCALALACQGDIRAPPPPGPIEPVPVPDPVAVACANHALPTQPLRRLSSEQYRNTLVDLFGPALSAPLVAGALYPPTVIKTGFANDAEANTVNTSQSNAIEDDAERMAALVMAGPTPYLRALLPCTLPTNIADSDIDGCVDAFITGFGARAYRRPLTAPEAALARGVYDTVRASQSATNAWASVLQLFLEAPATLYRVERGTGPAGTGDLVALTGHEMASRLSYLFVNSMPDAELFAAAAAGKLSTPAEIEAQARRLMQSPRFVDALAGFHRDWLHLYEAAAGKDPVLFPDYTAAVQASLEREPRELLAYVLEQGDGSLKQLLGGTVLPIDGTLAAYYGAAPVSGWAAAEAPNRVGLFSRASVMAALAKSTASSPIHRGNFMRNSVLCEQELILPANVDTSTPLQNTAGLPTARQRLEPLTTQGTCSGCHKQINPLGLSLENYDAAGRWRDQENGVTIDASGEVDFGNGSRAYLTAKELFGLMSESPKVQRCYALQWFRASLGRLEMAEDRCSVVTLQTLVAKSGGDLRELMVALTSTDAFRYRRPVEGP